MAAETKSLVPKGGLEPPHPLGHMTLNHARLPIPPLRREERRSYYPQGVSSQADGGGDRTISTNRRARHEYEILETIEAGLVLRGSEVKSLRDAKVQITDSFARIDGNEVWLHQLHIAPWLYSQSHTGHDPDQKRKLLLHHHEIMRLKARVEPEHLSLIPLSIYFKEGRAKVELGLAKSRRTHDKRQVIAERDAARDLARANRGDRRD
jgi:SsrA-binding protein